MKQIDDLLKWFNNQDGVLIALSGGVDSALVAYAAFLQLGHNAIAVTADYRTLSQEELDSAKSVCTEIGIRQITLEYNELENKDFVINDNTRCYHCRMELGGRLINLAKKMNNSWTVIDGTNLDDLGDYRPGIKAMKKNHIRSPLLETGFTKRDVRAVAYNAGLSIHDRPSNSCLASRIPWGVRITAEKLARIELGEKIVRQMSGARQVRVRDIDGSARIEVEPEILYIFDRTVCDANVIDNSAIYGKLADDNGNCNDETTCDDILYADKYFDASTQYVDSDFVHPENHTIGKKCRKLLDVITDKLVMIGFNDVVLDSEGYRAGKINDVMLD